MKAFVTGGGTEFIGGKAVDHLVENRHSVRLFSSYGRVKHPGIWRQESNCR
jgi:nucleoside-diphosphate-sugar epimerase